MYVYIYTYMYIYRQLAEHMKVVHNLKLLFKCEVEGCEYKSSRKDKLNRHMLTHRYYTNQSNCILFFFSI